jgi:nucleotide-binding universal stress UspA family protein
MMGSHGRGGLSLFVMGSTTEGVLRSSEVPVLSSASVASSG